MSGRGGELKFLKAVQGAIRVEAGKRLPPLLKRWRYTQSSDNAELTLKPGTTRFLVRYGSLDAGKDPAAQGEEYRKLLQRISRTSGDAPGIVAAWIELFAEGEYGVLQSGVCAAEPRCAACPLKDDCRYLAAGGRDAHSFGQSMARELLLPGVERSSDLRAAELLAFAMSGEKCGAADIARAEAALKACNGLRGVFLAPTETLRKLEFSDAALSRLNAIAELCRHWAGEKTARGRTFSCGEDFFNHFHLRLRDLKQEVFIVALLDQKHALIAEDQVSAGSLTETLVHPREVFAQAIAKRAVSIALIHNHPSGDPQPSKQDKAITRRLKSVAELVGIRLLDHVIIGDGRFISFVDDGIMD